MQFYGIQVSKDIFIIKLIDLNYNFLVNSLLKKRDKIRDKINLLFSDEIIQLLEIIMYV